MCNSTPCRRAIAATSARACLLRGGMPEKCWFGEARDNVGACDADSHSSAMSTLAASSQPPTANWDVERGAAHGHVFTSEI